MTAGALSAIVARLEQEGFRALPEPASISGIDFDFGCVLVGPEGSLDLVVVEQVIDSESTFNQISAVARALDLVESRRSITLVVVGALSTLQSYDDLLKLCRVLSVEDHTSKTKMNDSLAALLPLSLPQSEGRAVDPISRTWAQVSLKYADTLRESPVIDNSLRGVDDVRRAYKGWIEGALRTKEAE